MVSHTTKAFYLQKQLQVNAKRVLFCVYFVLQCFEWRAAKREVLLCGPAASVWDYPSGKRPTRTPGSVGHSKPHEQACVDIIQSFFTPLRRQPFVQAPVFFLFEVCPCSSLIWTLSRKLCATSTNRCLCAVSMVTALSVKCKCLLVSVWRVHREIQQNG